MDAERIDLPDASVDAVLCRFAYMLMTDPARGAGPDQARAAAGRPGALSVWAAPGAIPGSRSARACCASGLAPPPAPGEPSPFGLADEGRLRGLLDGAGLVDARLEEVEVAIEYRDAADWLDLVTDTSGSSGRPSGPLARTIARRSEPASRRPTRPSRPRTACGSPGWRSAPSPRRLDPRRGGLLQ